LVKEVIVAYGHPNVQATHPSTLMLTKETHLSKAGDCIIAVGADKSVSDLSAEFKNAIRKPNAKLTIIIAAGSMEQQVNAAGSPELVLTDPSDIVVRKSSYISERTVAIRADKSSSDLSRQLVSRLKDPKQTIRVSLVVT